MPPPGFAYDLVKNVVSGAGGVAISCGVPPGETDGELLWAHTAWRGDGLHSNTEAAFTELVDFSQAFGPSLGVYTKTAASEPSAYNFGFSGAAARVLACIGRVTGSSGVEASGFANGGGAAGTDMVAPSLVSLGAERLLVCVFVSTHLDLFIPPAVMGVITSDNSGGSEVGTVRYNLCRQVVGAGATGTRTATIAVARNWVAASVLFAPSRLGPIGKRRSNYPHYRSRRG